MLPQGSLVRREWPPRRSEWWIASLRHAATGYSEAAEGVEDGETRLPESSTHGAANLGNNFRAIDPFAASRRPLGEGDSECYAAAVRARRLWNRQASSVSWCPWAWACFPAFVSVPVAGRSRQMPWKRQGFPNPVGQDPLGPRRPDQAGYHYAAQICPRNSPETKQTLQVSTL